MQFNVNFRRIVPRFAVDAYRKSRIANYLVRRKTTQKYLQPTNLLARRWRFQKTETSNFYYSLQASNVSDLTCLLSIVLEVPINQIDCYVAELESDINLRNHFRNFLTQNNMPDSNADYARRLAWYAIARTRKPKLIVETGVSDGIGSCILGLALERNSREGFAGKYMGIDINPNSGKLFSDPYKKFGDIVISDSLEALAKIESKVDLFISDSSHDNKYEYQEYCEIISKMSSIGIIIGDNSHASPSLRNFSIESGRKFVYFQEIPKSHWYPGAGIGISFL